MKQKMKRLLSLNAPTAWFACFISVAVMSGCATQQKINVGAESRELVNEMLESAFLKDKSTTFTAFVYPYLCSEMGETMGKLSVSGAVGESAKIGLYCGDTLYDGCTATIPPGGRTKKCETTKKLPTDIRKLFSCKTEKVAGNPGYVGSCFDP